MYYRGGEQVLQTSLQVNHQAGQGQLRTDEIHCCLQCSQSGDGIHGLLEGRGGANTGAGGSCRKCVQLHESVDGQGG